MVVSKRQLTWTCKSLTGELYILPQAVFDNQLKFSPQFIKFMKELTTT